MIERVCRYVHPSTFEIKPVTALTNEVVKELLGLF